MDEKIPKVKITIKSPSKSVELEAKRGIGFQGVCAKHETAIEFNCRAGDCGICCIKILSGEANLSKPTAIEADFLKAMRADPDERLACQTRVFGDVSVEADYL